MTEPSQPSSGSDSHPSRALVARLSRRFPRLVRALRFIHREANFPGQAPAHMRHKSAFYQPEGAQMPPHSVVAVDPEEIRKAAVARRSEAGRDSTAAGAYWFLDDADAETGQWSQTDASPAGAQPADPAAPGKDDTHEP